MTAATADRLPVYAAQRGEPLDLPYPMTASASVHLNCLVNADSAGNVKDATDAAAEMCVGIATKGLTCSAVAGSTTAVVRRGVVVEFFINGADIDVTDIGKNASIKDNQTVTDAATAANDVRIGEIVDVRNGKAYVRVGSFAPSAA
jgi:hypothetical protein